MKTLIAYLLIGSAIIVPIAANDIFGSVGRAGWISSAVCLLLGWLILKSGKMKQGKRRNKPLYDTLSDLADAVEAKEAVIDVNIKSVFKDLYLDLDGIASEIEDDDIRDSLIMITSDLERIVWPNGMTQKQAESLSKRQSKRTK